MKKLVVLMLCGVLLTGCATKEDSVSAAIQRVEVELPTVVTHEPETVSTMSGSEALEHAKTVLTEGVKMTVDTSGFVTTMSLVNEVAKMELNGLIVYSTNNFMYLVDADGKASKVPVGEFEGEDITAAIGSVEEVKKGIYDILDNLCNPDTTEDVNVFAVEHIIDDTTMSGNIYFEDGAFECIKISNKDTTVTIEPYRENLEDVVKSINATEISIDDAMSIIFSVIFDETEIDMNEEAETETEEVATSTDHNVE